MPRILHIIDSLDYSGAARQLFVLSQALALRGFDVHVAALTAGGAMGAEFRAAALPTTELARRRSFDPITFHRLKRLIGRLRPDVIHTWDDVSSIYGRTAARLEHVSRVIVGHHRIEPWKPHWQWAVERRLARHTPQFVTSSVHVRDWYVRHGLPAEKFAVIPPGVPPAPASDLSREELLCELNLPTDARLIGVVGRLVPHKRVKNLIWAADLLRVLHDNLRLLVIGAGPQRQTLEQYARLASDLDHIQFLGQRSDMWRIMPHLDVFWNADEPRGHSMAILAAMSAGVPVIASDTPFNRELIAHNETGYHVPLYQRSGRADRARYTDRIFTDKELTDRLATNSQQRISERFGTQQTVRGYVETYQMLLA